MPKTYKESGVDINKDEAAVSEIVKILKSTYSTRQDKTGKVIDLPNHYSNLIDLGDQALAMSTDSVGSKVLIAQLADNYTTIGIDMIAMVANDLICVGAEPLALVDYVAFEKTNQKTATEIASFPRDITSSFELNSKYS